MIFNFVKKLEERLLSGLPGAIAQYAMAPLNRASADHYLKQGIVPRKGGVLILLYEHQGLINVVLTLRREYNGVHSRQVSFPGGKQEPGDENLMQTALRESKEEVGINPNSIRVITKMTDLYIPPSNFLVSPYLAYALERPCFIADEHEVEELLEFPLKYFVENQNKLKDHQITVQGNKIAVPAYHIEGKIIWGATAMIISELMVLCGDLLID